MTGYYLTLNEDEYVESYDLTGKTVDVSCSREDAMQFSNKSEAEYIAERIGGKVNNF